MDKRKVEYKFRYSADCSYSEEYRTLRTQEDAEKYKLDARLNFVVPKSLEYRNEYMLNYIEHLRHVVLQSKESTAWEGYLRCGMLPIGIEPTFWLHTWNPFIKASLEELNVPYYEINISSPFNKRMEYQYKTFSTAKDIWVSKLDAAKIVNKEAHNIKTMDVLEVLLFK